MNKKISIILCSYNEVHYIEECISLINGDINNYTCIPEVRIIGDGEPNDTGDPDGDGFQGEDDSWPQGRLPVCPRLLFHSVRRSRWDKSRAQLRPRSGTSRTGWKTRTRWRRGGPSF